MRMKICAIAVAVAAVVFCAAAWAGNNLSSYTKSKKTIAVFVKDVKNSSGQNTVSADEFKKELEKAFANRRSVSFRVVPDAASSDVQVTADITHYAYAGTDPVKPTISAAGLLLDALTSENYAEMTALFTVYDTLTGAMVWQDPIEDYVKEKMTIAQSMPLIYDKVARKFLWKSFGKGT